MITALRMRTNSCANRVAMNRTVPVPNLNCRQCDTQLESLGHIPGQCRYTKSSRIRRHNEIRDLIVAESTKQGATVATPATVSSHRSQSPTNSGRNERGDAQGEYQVPSQTWVKK
ncbi:hypothetical protein JTB14_008864 [Gonioctena quinquepunctata]|nr:hypothetical protein JTB14_008864 [Gonioctena quinquepunctata]